MDFRIFTAPKTFDFCFHSLLGSLLWVQLEKLKSRETLHTDVLFCSQVFLGESNLHLPLVLESAVCKLDGCEGKVDERQMRARTCWNHTSSRDRTHVTSLVSDLSGVSVLQGPSPASCS